MNEYTYNIHTGHHADSKQKEMKGAAFGAVIEQGGVKIRKTLTSLEDTYMTIWLKGIVMVLKQIEKEARRSEEGATINVNVFFWHSNIQAIAAKMSSIFKDLKEFQDDVDRLLDRKLARKNRTRYDHHDDQKAIISTLLSIHKMRTLHVKFKPTPPHGADMGIAYQEAQMALEGINVTA